MIDVRFHVDQAVACGIMIPESESEIPQSGCGGGIVLPKQTHSSNIAIISDNSQCLDDTDGVITTTPLLRIGVRTADCVPLIIYAPDVEAVAAVHAGWKGTIAGIAGKTVDAICSMGADPTLMKIRLGPCICGACYEIDKSLAAQFAESGFRSCISRLNTNDKPHLDLVAANRLTLESKGVVDIEWCGLCTMHSAISNSMRLQKKLPSWRRKYGEKSRIVTWIELK